MQQLCSFIPSSCVTKYLIALCLKFSKSIHRLKLSGDCVEHSAAGRFCNAQTVIIPHIKNQGNYLTKGQFTNNDNQFGNLMA